MYELFDDQKHDVASIRRLLSQQRKTIYAASTGSGKTVTAGHIMQSASRKGSKVLVLVHRRELVGQFVHTLHEAGLDDRVGVVCGGWTPTPWAPIQVAMVFSWARRKMSFRPDLIIIDECFVAGTPVLMADGTELPIEAVRPNDRVMSAFGPCVVASCSVSWTHHIREMRLSNGQRIRCTQNHPFLTRSGWTQARNLGVGSHLLRPQDLSAMWQALWPESGDRQRDGEMAGHASEKLRENHLLFEILFQEVQEPHVRQENTGQVVEKSEGHGAWTTREGGQRQRSYESASRLAELAGGWLDGGTCRAHETGSAGIPAPLQDRSGQPFGNDRHRGGRAVARHPFSEVAGREEGPIPEGIRVESIEDQERTRPVRVFNLAVNGHPSFVVGGAVVHNCHHAKAKTWETVIERYPDAYLLGLTATPVRLDGKGLSPPFRSMHCGLSTPELIEAGRLSPIHVLRIPSSFRKKGLRMTGGEYNRKDMEKKADAKFVADAVNAYLKYTPDRQCIMFGVSKRHARDVAERFAEFGVSAAAVGDDTPDPVREDTFRQFARGGIRVVCNVSLIDEGFDVPACDVVIDAAPTASVVRYLQRAGRAMRYREGKMAILLDLVGNSYDHGLPDQSREWELVVDNPKDLREENRRKGNNLRCCRQCLCLFSPKLVECPHCGTEHDGTPVHEIDIDLIEAKPKEPKRPKAKMTMRERGQKTGEAKSLARLGKYDEAWEAIKSVQMEAEYHNGWAHITADLIGIPHENRHSGD